jgi:hypothetical protein
MHKLLVTLLSPGLTYASETHISCQKLSMILYLHVFLLELLFADRIFN